jgi:hypothetical protein
VTLSLGAPIGHYTVLEQVCAEGAFAEVYRARDERHDRVVALKLLAGTSERSRRDALAVATLDHPNIVATFDVFEHDGRLCLVQEWIDGGSLAAELDAAGQLDVQQTVRLGHDLASALSYAHQQNILHRDIKPSNVLRTAKGTYKLADFGAFGRLSVDTALTRTGEIAGTPLYMSPEQLTGAPQSAASDLFGLGLLLYRCLHGQLPDETAGSFVQLAYGRVVTPIRVPPSPLQGLLERCLALDPAQRPHSATEVLSALDQIAPDQQGHGAAGGWQAGPPRPEAALPPSQLPPPGRTPASARLSLRRRKAWVLRVVLVVAVVLAGVVSFVITTAPPDVGGISPPGTGIGPPDVGIGLVRIGAGVVIAVLALAGAQQIRRRWTSRAPEAERKAATVLFGAGQREELTRSLMIEVDQVVRNLDSFDAKFLGMTVVAMIREYEQAKESSERQAALLNVVVLMEKLQVRFSPWYVRHKDAIATGVAVVGALAGAASVVSGFLK